LTLNSHHLELLHKIPHCIFQLLNVLLHFNYGFIRLNAGPADITVSSLTLIQIFGLVSRSC